jgi:hypothetical protein
MLKLGQVVHVRCERGWSLQAAWSQRLADCDLWYVCAGSGRMRLADGRDIHLESGVAIWARPGGLYLAT